MLSLYELVTKPSLSQDVPPAPLLNNRSIYIFVCGKHFDLISEACKYLA